MEYVECRACGKTYNAEWFCQLHTGEGSICLSCCQATCGQDGGLCLRHGDVSYQGLGTKNSTERSDDLISLTNMKISSTITQQGTSRLKKYKGSNCVFCCIKGFLTFMDSDRAKSKYHLKRAQQIGFQLAEKYKAVLYRAYDLYRKNHVKESRMLVQSLWLANDLEFPKGNVCVVCSNTRTLNIIGLDSSKGMRPQDFNDLISRIQAMDDCEVKRNFFTERDCSICGLTILKQYKRHILLHKLKERKLGEHFVFNNKGVRITPSIKCRKCQRHFSIGSAFQALEDHRDQCYGHALQNSSVILAYRLESLQQVVKRVTNQMNSIDKQLKLIMSLQQLLNSLIILLTI